MKHEFLAEPRGGGSPFDLLRSLRASPKIANQAPAYRQAGFFGRIRG